MKRKDARRRMLAGVALATAATLHYPASAALVATDDAAGAPLREQVQAQVDRPDVARQLQEMGVSPEEARARVDAMTDDELRHIAGKVGALPAGGQLSNNQLLIISLLVIILLLIL